MIIIRQLRVYTVTDTVMISFLSTGNDHGSLLVTTFCAVSVLAAVLMM